MISIDNLSFYYKKEKPILTEINASLKAGHVYGLFGLNGCGKTTLLKLICASLYPKTGSIQAGEHRVADRKLDFLADLYLVTDEVDLPNWKIADILSVYSPLYPKFDQQYFAAILDKFQVDIKEHIKSLSYGQRKKVNIAFALASNVSLLLMDEPTNGLDIPAKTQFRKLLVSHIAADRTIIISTHQTRDVQQLIDHLLILKENRLVLDASLQSLSQQFEFKNGKLEAPLYAEHAYNGTQNIVLNKTGEDTAFDLELFFNAIHANPTILSYVDRQNQPQHV